MFHSFFMYLDEVDVVHNTSYYTNLLGISLQFHKTKCNIKTIGPMKFPRITIFFRKLNFI